MLNQKHALKSKGINGSIIAILSSLVMLIFSKDPSTKLIALTNLFGGILALYGRWTAKDKLYIRRKKDAKSNN